MTGTEQVLYLVVVPAVVVAVVWALASIGGPEARKRYRPGRPYTFAPVWYVANHRRGGPATAGEAPALTSGAEVGHGTTGGASDRW